MTDRAKKVTELEALTTATAGDLLLIVDDPGGTPESKKITVANFIGNVSTNAVFRTSLTVNGSVTLAGNTVITRPLTVSNTVSISSNLNINSNILVQNTAVINSTGYWVGNSTGLKGDAGDKGDTGDKGDKGDTGSTGSTGDKGDTGSTGSTGDKGDKGDTGSTGTIGDKGDKGDLGDKGDKGDIGTTPNNDILSIKTIEETFVSLSNANGTLTHDCSNTHIFNHTSIASNFTANFTNLNLSNNYATTVVLILNQGASAYVANAVQISGSGQTVNWQGNTSAPTGNANKKDVMSFSIINSSGAYTVFGQLTSFG